MPVLTGNIQNGRFKVADRKQVELTNPLILEDSGERGSIFVDSSGNVKFLSGSVVSDVENEGTTLSAATGADTALSNIGSVSIPNAGDLLFANDNQVEIGSSSKGAKNIYVSTALYTDTISEKSSAEGVTIDGVKLKDSEPYCDVINEKTAATGVTIDSVLLKDGKMNTDYLETTSEAQGDVLYHNGTKWTRLAAGTDGKFLKTQGASANPTWANPTALTCGGLEDSFTLEGGTHDPVTTITQQTTGAASLTIPDLANTSQQWVFTKVAQTLENKTLTAPKFADNGYIADDSGNEQIVFGKVASAVNEIKVTNAATGSHPSIAAQGGDTNIDLLLAAKGTGVVKAGDVEVVTLSDSQTLTSKTLTSPVVGTQITLDQTTADYTVTWDDPEEARALTFGDPGGNDSVAYLAAAQTLTNKTIDVDSNTVSNINGDEMNPVAGTNATYGIPIVVFGVNGGAGSVNIFDSDAPFKFRVVDAWAVSTKGANSGTWKLTDGTNDITNTVAYGTSDKDIARADAIDDLRHEIAASGSLVIVNSETTDTAIVYVSVVRITT